MKGKVYLVGAGPGDPELLTMKAVRMLQTADAVLHDELVSREILTLVPRRAALMDVGKRAGARKITQSEINFQLVNLAQSGLKVVRLKGGDPLIFGRAGEEMAALRAAGIDFEIVPGITAVLGAAASAEIPLTHRAASHALVFVAGHSAEGVDETDWPALVALKATLVIYMPGQYASMADRLLRAGLAAETSCAIISKATTAQEQVHKTTLKNLRSAPVLPAPALLVIGEVAGLDKRLGSAAAQDFWKTLPDEILSPISPDGGILQVESEGVSDGGYR